MLYLYSSVLEMKGGLRRDAIIGVQILTMQPMDANYSVPTEENDLSVCSFVAASSPGRGAKGLSIKRGSGHSFSLFPIPFSLCRPQAF